MSVPLRLLTAVVIAALPLAAVAQSAPADSGPKLLSRGTNATPPAGTGAVTVKVFVKSDGSFTVVDVLKSTNPGDNAAALEIAKSSTYQPAVRNGRHTSEYYDYALAFGGDTSSIGTGPIATATAAINAGKYDAAKSALATALQANPADTQAEVLLGVADGYSGDAAGAAAAFDKAGPVPDQYKIVALQAYTKNAGDQLDAKNFAGAVTSATAAIALNPQNVQAYYVRGIAGANTHDDAHAIADLQTAYALATAGKIDPPTAAAIAFNLAIVQFDAGSYADAVASAKLVAQYDPARRAQLDPYAAAAYNNSAIDIAKSGRLADAVARLEAGAADFPAVAATLTAEAANLMATAKTPNWVQVRAEAVKALGFDANNGRAAYFAGVAASRQNDKKAALAYMNRAKASPAYRTDAPLAKLIDDALKALNTPDS